MKYASIKHLACALVVALAFPTAAHAETKSASSADYVDGDNLAYTATADGEEVSFDSGADIVWGTTFSGNAASFNPYNASSVLTVLNPLVAIPNSSLGVAQGTTVFSGGLTPNTSISGSAWNAYFSKTGAGTAKFTGAVDFSANNYGPHFNVAEGVAQFAGSGITHKLVYLYVGRTAGSTAVFTNSGSTVSVSGRLFVGSDSAANDGTVSQGGSGTFVIDGGSATIAGNAYLGAGASGSSTVEVRGGGSLAMNGGYKYFGYGSANSSPRSVLKIGANGTLNSTVGTLVFGYEAGNIARLEMDGGLFNAINAIFGSKGSFRGTMTGGNVGITQNFYLGNYSTGVNRFDMLGGTFTASTSNYRYIGYNYGNTAAGAVTSVLTVARSAVFSTGSKSMYLGFGGSATATAHGEIHLADGGTFEAANINPNRNDYSDTFASRKLTSDGGTFRILGNGATVT